MIQNALFQEVVSSMAFATLVLTSPECSFNYGFEIAIAVAYLQLNGKLPEGEDLVLFTQQSNVPMGLSIWKVFIELMSQISCVKLWLLFPAAIF